ncbi:hypothetical protein TNCV_1191231 [Trichonephila clavipes]|nr:hypothetical protein TNCV_1191231 [Trichonephila clavipes]
MSSFLVLCEGNTRNRWRDGQVGPDVRQGTMAPWARRLGCVLACYAQIGQGRSRETFERKKVGRKRKKRSEEKDEKCPGERSDGENGEETRGGQERRRKKRAESGIGVKKTMNAGGVENGI